MPRYLNATLITALIAMLILSPTAPAASMAAVTMPTATTSTLLTAITAVARVSHLRGHDAPSLRTKVIFHLTRGQTVNVLGVSENLRWLKIRSADGQQGWVSLFYMRLVGGRVSQLRIVA